MSVAAGVQLQNGQAVDAGSVPVLETGAFRTAIITATGAGARVVSLFGRRTGDAGARLYAVLANDAAHSLTVVATYVAESFESITPDCPQAHLFEREICEQVGVMPEGHPWLKPVRGHNTLSVGRSADISPIKGGEGPPHMARAYPYFSMAGEEVHEVAVGPVHAGVIEPGHFRFQCTGEIVHHLEIHLGYQHRGVEEALVCGPHRRTMFEMETVAGDTTIGHGTAYSMVMESLGGVAAPIRAQALRAIALELERLANHTGDMGALANDVGFLPTTSFCGRLRGDFLNMSSVICGSRLGRGMVRPGGRGVRRFGARYAGRPAWQAGQGGTGRYRGAARLLL